MSAAALLLGFLNVALNCAVVVLVAFAIVYLLKAIFNISLDENVLKWGRIVVGLICLIIIVSWLLSVLGMAQPLGPHWLR